MTSLTARLKSFEPDLNGTAPSGDGRNAVEIIDRDSFEKLKAVAIELAEGLEQMSHEIYCEYWNDCKCNKRKLTKAAEMLERK